MQNARSQHCSHAGEIAAYLDGELSASNENAFELHLKNCAECAEKLNLQKRLLRALDLAFDDEKNFDLPVDFARSVAVRAESDVSGLRSKDERRRAFIITGGLFLFGVLVGVAGKKSGFLPSLVNGLGQQLSVIFKVLADFCYDFGLGLTVIWRVVGRHFLAESTFAIFLLAIFFVVSLVVLSHLLFKFRRTEQSG